jgi:hypothetical protein
VPQALLGNASAADSGSAGTADEQRLVGALLARDGHPADQDTSSIQTLLAGPMMRGTVVSTR